MPSKLEVEVRRKRFEPDPSLVLGEGGEAVVYDISPLFPPEQLALKLWKPPTHPDYAGSDEKAKRNRDGAELRLETFGRKLLAFPTALPDQVVRPLDLAKELRGGKVLGYTMRKLLGAHKLMKLASRADRQSLAVDDVKLVQLFIKLHETVRQVHKAGVVIGDFNYSNVLVLLQQLEAYIIDADSMQFSSPLEQFICRTYTPRFVDPLICDAKQKNPVQLQAPNPNSDWYSFALMFFECLMYTPLYGGAYTPAKGKPNVTHDERPLQRISVFHPNVTYPGPNKALPLSWLPARVRGYFEELVTAGKDARGEFPRTHLETLLAHAAGKYVDPATVPARAAVQEIIRGKIRWTKMHDEVGPIVAAQLDGSTLRYLYHASEEYRREDGRVVLHGEYNPDYRFRILGRKTVVGFQDQIVILQDGAAPLRYLVSRYQGTKQIFDASGGNLVWCRDSSLYREGDLGQEFIGNVLENQTLVWVGPKFGFGFYRMDGYRVAFTFDPQGRGVTETAKLPPLPGELVDAACFFTPHRCWFLVSLRFNGVISNLCLVFNEAGELIAQAKAEQGDGSWLDGIRGKAAVMFGGGKKPLQHMLFSVTDKGLVLVEEQGNALEVRAAFPDTEDLVDMRDTLLYDPAKGLYVANRSSIHLLTLN